MFIEYATKVLKLIKNTLAGDVGDPAGARAVRVVVLEEPTLSNGGPNRPVGQLMRGTQAPTPTKCDTGASKWRSTERLTRAN